MSRKLRDAMRQQGSEARRLDTRLKIELGGLVVKAGLSEDDRAFVLGALMEAAKRRAEPDEYERVRRIGVRALGGRI